jgi:ankyrin repeat protein
MEVPFDEPMPPSKRAVDIIDEEGNTCLMISCELGHYEVASYLLKKGFCFLIDRSYCF